jgi:hypothetical protein
VVIATVFLTIIGMTGGYVLGERHRRATNAQQEQQQGQQQHQQQQQQPTSGPISSSGPSTSGAAGAGTLCPPETQSEAVRLGFETGLTQVRRYLTTNGTVVWICRDPDGHLFYQGKIGGADAPLEQGTNALLLNDVVKTAVDTYKAVSKSDGVTFVISPQALVVTKTDGTERYPVKSME